MLMVANVFVCFCFFDFYVAHLTESFYNKKHLNNIHTPRLLQADKKKIEKV